jgi:hypothetical protein
VFGLLEENLVPWQSFKERESTSHKLNEPNY